MLTIKFYQNAKKKEPVKEWLKNLNSAERREISNNLQKLQLGWEKGLVREPLVKNLKGGLWELRTHLPSHKISRVIFCFFDENIILLHGFIKKTQKIAFLDINLAKTRKRLLEHSR